MSKVFINILIELALFKIKVNFLWSSNFCFSYKHRSGTVGCYKKCKIKISQCFFYKECVAFSLFIRKYESPICCSLYEHWVLSIIFPCYSLCIDISSIFLMANNLGTFYLCFHAIFILSFINIC